MFGHTDFGDEGELSIHLWPFGGALNFSQGGVINFIGEPDGATFHNNNRDVYLRNAFSPNGSDAYQNIFDGGISNIEPGYFDYIDLRERVRLFSNTGSTFQDFSFKNDVPDIIVETELIAINSERSPFLFYSSDETSVQVTNFTRGVTARGQMTNKETRIQGIDFSCYRSLYFLNGSRYVYSCTFENLDPSVLYNMGSVTVEGWTDPNLDPPAYACYFDGSNSIFRFRGNLDIDVQNPLSDVNYGVIANSTVNANSVWGNIFNNCNYATCFTGDNKNGTSGLTFRCNTFNNCDFDVCVLPGNDGSAAGIQVNQGSIGLSSRNDFNNSHDPFIDFDDIIDETSSGHNYFYNNITDGLILSETFGINPFGNPTSNNPCNLQIPAVPSLASPGGGSESLVSLNQSYSEKMYEYHALVDGGNTEALKNEVIMTTYSNAITTYYELLSYSPDLSEQVLLETIEKEFDLPNALVQSILSSNPQAAKSPLIRQKIEEKMIPFDEYQKMLILEGLEWLSQKELLEAEMSEIIHERSDILNQLVIDESIGIVTAENLLSFLQPDLFISDAYLKVSYLQQENILLAIETLESIAANFELSEMEINDIQNWITVLEIYNLYTNDSETELPNFYTTLLEDIYDIHCGFSTGLALELLIQTGELEYSEPMFQINSFVEQRSTSVESEIQSTLFSIYPNPTASFITFNRRYNDKALLIQIKDITGRLITELSIFDGSQELVIDLVPLQPGSYNFSVVQTDGVVLFQETLIKL